jgi:hypothetical protein
MEIEIKCIGYKKSFVGQMMWYYKAEIMNKEYLFIHIPEDRGCLNFLDMVWNSKNNFDDSKLSENMLDVIKNSLNDVHKSDIFLNEDDEKKYFKQNEICPIKKKTKRGNKYTGDEINEILNVLSEYGFIDNENKYNTITKELSHYADNKCSINGLFKKLIGYDFKYSTDGEHKNDGQMVEYEFIFKSPKDIKTYIVTEKCLMNGWNHWEDETIL